MSNTHLDSKPIANLLERCRCLWERKVPQVGKISAYATNRGLVVFLDFVFLDFIKGRGWTMLTEHPGIMVDDHTKTLQRMIEGGHETVIVTYARGEILETYANTKAMREGKPRGTLNGIADMIDELGADSGSCPRNPDIKFRVMRVRR